MYFLLQIISYVFYIIILFPLHLYGVLPNILNDGDDYGKFTIRK